VHLFGRDPSRDPSPSHVDARSAVGHTFAHAPVGLGASMDFGDRSCIEARGGAARHICDRPWRDGRGRAPSAGARESAPRRPGSSGRRATWLARHGRVDATATSCFLGRSVAEIPRSRSEPGASIWRRPRR